MPASIKIMYSLMLFIKYISDKYAGVPYAAITVPPGASFKDMVALKGKSTIGDDINKKIIAQLNKPTNHWVLLKWILIILKS
jgi:hypothetical protein